MRKYVHRTAIFPAHQRVWRLTRMPLFRSCARAAARNRRPQCARSSSSYLKAVIATVASRHLNAAARWRLRALRGLAPHVHVAVTLSWLASSMAWYLHLWRTLCVSRGVTRIICAALICAAHISCTKHETSGTLLLSKYYSLARKLIVAAAYGNDKQMAKRINANINKETEASKLV